MEKETLAYFKEAFFNNLLTIKSKMEHNGGSFSNRAMLYDALECVRGIKNVNKIMAMPEASVASATAVVK